MSGFEPRRPVALIVAIAALAISAAVWIGSVTLFRSYYVPSAANEPTVGPGDHVLVRLSGDADAGDLVVYEAPEADGPSQRISRVVATAGHTIEARLGRVLVDGERLDEPYLPADLTTNDFDRVEIPDGAIFLLSDNRPNSRDSRMFGPVDEDAIVGTVRFVNAPRTLPMWATAGSAVVVIITARRAAARRAPGQDSA